jgi:Fe-S cluster assembly protein SufD
MNKIIIEKELLKNAQPFLKTNNGFKNKAFEYFEKNGLPTKMAEHFSPRFHDQNKEILSNTKETPVDPRGVIVFINGIYNSEQTILPAGIEICEKDVNSTNEYVFQDSFDALNVLSAVSTTQINIKKNTNSGFPITIIHTLTEAGVNKIVSPRIEINVDANSEVDFLEVFTTTDMALYQYTTNSQTILNIGENSQIEYIKLTNEAKNALHLNWTKANLAKDARFFSTVIDSGQNLGIHNLLINLENTGATTSANSLFRINQTQQNSILTTINHKHSHTYSSQLCKGILNDEAFGIFNGTIKVFPDAQEITSSQLNKNLLLSKKAHIDTRPQLLISADDVKCTHGATVGQLSDEEAFYLESRGIKKSRAMEMLLNGFSQEIILLIKNKNIREYCEKKLK